MTGEAARYAVYFVPAADSDLYGFGRSIHGYDCYTGEEIPFAADIGLDAKTWRALTEEPRRYGFHATLKAPFRLASHREAALIEAFLVFAAENRPLARIVPHVRMLSSFVAIVPRERSPALDELAAQCTMAFDRFRAPVSAQERARRVAAGLTPDQVNNLDRWGYPYVFSDFRFHMTLATKIPVGRQDEVVTALERAFAHACGDHPVAIDRLSLLKQDDAQARFRVICQAALKGGS